MVELPETWVAHVREHGEILREPLLHTPGEMTRLMKRIYHETHWATRTINRRR